MRLTLGILAFVLWLFGDLSGLAWAQTGSVDTIEQRIQQLRPPAALALPPEEAILTGREDVVLLRRRKLFTLSANAGYRFTDNAFLSDEFRESDQIFEPTLTLRAATRIAERYEVFAEVRGFAARYQDNSELDFDGFTGRLGGEMPVDSWLIGSSYSGSVAYERGLGAHLVTLHEIDLSARRGVPLDQQTALWLSFRASRAFADPDDFTTVSGEARLTLVRSLHDDIIGLVGILGNVRRYDDFFETATGETRLDDGAIGQAALVWRPVEWFSVSGVVELTQNWSSVGLNEYHGIEVFPALNLTARF